MDAAVTPGTDGSVTESPSRIGTFEVIRQIGTGGMGSVYLGRDPELNRQVAIKVIREEVRDQDALDRFFREARAAAALRHPNIVTIYASGQQEHKPYMVMEFVEGESLADIIRTRRDLSVFTKLSYLEQLCAGLHVAHRAGIVHRDVKPANVMVDKEGIVRILDFGIARVEGAPVTQDGALVGSLNYMSPEQMLAKPVDHRSDIFALGSVAYEVFSYERAFKGGLNDGLLQRLPYENPTALSQICPGLPVGLEGIIVRAMQKAPEDRFQDLAEMRNAVVEIQRRFDANEEERTLLLPRDEMDENGDQGDEPVPVFVDVPPAWVPNPTSEIVFPDPVAEAEPPPTPATPLVPNVAWSVQKKEDTSRTPKPKVVAKALPTPDPRPPVSSPPSSPWRLGIAAAAAIVRAGAAVAIPWPNATASDPLTRERPGIESALERFRIAYRNRDIDAVASAFPAIPRALKQQMERTFRDCLIYELVFDMVSLELISADASHVRADVASTHVCTPQSGGPEKSVSGPEVYTLEKTGQDWSITDVTLTAGLSARPH